MWITKDVNLPENLIDAQSRGKVVVFAGAGVSIASPSKMPTFQKLASQIASGAYKRQRNEPLDRFLGRLKDNGVHVHARAREIIGNPKSKPNELHYTILQLFHSPDKIRLVTTNFDRHFTTAAQELYEDDVEFYYAPALPLGRKFNGIVYLHGSVEKQPYRLVLTDSNFGRAYLTDGWARRFLQAMFEEYTVLFVGYSHDDPVMNYLSRGLPPNTFRYALTEPKSQDRWQRLGIQPIVYPKKNGKNDHSALLKALKS